MGNNGKAWKSMGTMERQGKVVKKQGTAWETMEKHGKAWKSNGKHGKAWKSIGFIDIGEISFSQGAKTLYKTFILGSFSALGEEITSNHPESPENTNNSP